MKKTFLLVLMIPFVCLGQYEKQVDSLNSIINSKIDATKKIDTYRKLIEIYLGSDMDKAQKKINELYRLNKNNQCVKCEIVADYMQANYLAYTNGDPKKIDLYYDKCIEKAIASKDHDYYCIATGRKLNDYLTYNEIEKAEKGIEKAVNYCKKVNYHEHDDTFYVIQATIYQNKDYYNLAIENYLKAEKFCNDNNIKDYAFRTDLINSIAMIYLDMNNFKKARQYSDISIQLSKKSLDPMSKVNTIYRRGVIEYNAKNNKNSLSYLLKAYKTCDSINNTPYKCAIALFIGKNYQELNDLPKASLYTEMALKQFEELKNVPFWSGSLINNALINIKKSDFSAAKKELEQAKSMLKEVKGTLEYLPLIDAEIELSKKSNDINNVVKLIGVRDSIKAIMDEKTNLNSLNEFEAKYQAEKKEQQIKLLSTQNELAQKQKFMAITYLLNPHT